MFFLSSYLACLTMSPKMVFSVGSSYTIFREEFMGFQVFLYLIICTCLHYKLCDDAACFILVVHFWLAQQLVHF